MRRSMVTVPSTTNPIPQVQSVSRTQQGPWKHKNSRFSSMQGVKNDAHDEIYIPNQDAFIGEVMNRVMNETNLPDVIGNRANANQSIPVHNMRGSHPPSSMQMSSVVFPFDTNSNIQRSDGFSNKRQSQKPDSNKSGLINRHNPPATNQSQQYVGSMVIMGNDPGQDYSNAYQNRKANVARNVNLIRQGNPTSFANNTFTQTNTQNSSGVRQPEVPSPIQLHNHERAQSMLSIPSVAVVTEQASEQDVSPMVAKTKQTTIQSVGALEDQDFDRTNSHQS